MHKPIAVRPTTDQETTAEFLALQKQLGTSSRLLLIGCTLVTKPWDEKLHHIGFRRLIAFAGHDMHGNLGKPFAHPGAFFVLLLLPVFIEGTNLTTQLHMFCLFPLTEQDHPHIRRTSQLAAPEAVCGSSAQWQ